MKKKFLCGEHIEENENSEKKKKPQIKRKYWQSP